MDAGGRSGKDTRCELRCSWNEAIQPVLLPPNASSGVQTLYYIPGNTLYCIILKGK